MGEGFEIHSASADDDGAFASRLDFLDNRKREISEGERIAFFSRIKNGVKVMWSLAEVGLWWDSAESFQPTVGLGDVCIDNLAIELLSKRDAEGSGAGSKWTADVDGR